MNKRTQAIRPVVIIFLATVFVGIWAAIWYGSGMFDDAVAPTPDANGMVSTGSANVANTLSTVIEIVVIIISTIGSVALSLIFGAVKWLSGIIINLINGDDDEQPSGPLPAPNAQDKKSLAEAIQQEYGPNGVQQVPDTDERVEAMWTMLRDAIDNEDKEWTIALIHRISGTKYLAPWITKPKPPAPTEPVKPRGEQGGT